MFHLISEWLKGDLAASKDVIRAIDIFVGEVYVKWLLAILNLEGKDLSPHWMSNILRNLAGFNLLTLNCKNHVRFNL